MTEGFIFETEPESYPPEVEPLSEEDLEKFIMQFDAIREYFASINASVILEEDSTGLKTACEHIHPHKKMVAVRNPFKNPYTDGPALAEIKIVDDKTIKRVLVSMDEGIPFAFGYILHKTNPSLNQYFFNSQALEQGSLLASLLFPLEGFSTSSSTQRRNIPPNPASIKQ